MRLEEGIGYTMEDHKTKGLIVMNNIKLVTITGPSCSGKTTLLNKLCEAYNFKKVVSFTSRAPRRGEINDVDYHFITSFECQDLITSGQVQEYTVFKDNYYGVLKRDFVNMSKDDKIPVLIVDPAGLKQYREYFRDKIHSIYVDVPLTLMVERFLTRFKENESDEESIKYQAGRFLSMIQERSWVFHCEHDRLINQFTNDNSDEVILSILKDIA